MHLHRFATIDASAPSTGSTRIVSVDLLRGLVMMLMALDHTRDYFSGLPYAPEDLSKTFGALFFTRDITHICAPVFFLLAGAGAYLAVARGKSLQQVSRFFWTRGLWLVFLVSRPPFGSREMISPALKRPIPDGQTPVPSSAESLSSLRPGDGAQHQSLHDRETRQQDEESS